MFLMVWCHTSKNEMAPYCVWCDHTIHNVSMKLHLASQCTIGQSNCRCYDKKHCVSCARAMARASKAAVFERMKQNTQNQRKNKISCVGALAMWVGHLMELGVSCLVLQ